MPRLIKLSSDNEVVADFQNFFTEDIVIEPNSKVALYNLSLTLAQKTFEVNLSNFAFQVQVKGRSNNTGGLRQCLMRLGTYNQSGFLQELTRAINSSMQIVDGASNGASRNEWKPIFKAEKLNIQYASVSDDTNANIQFVLGKLAFANAVLGKAGTNGVWESAFTKNVFCNGVGIMGCTLVTGDDGVCFGLVSDITSANTLTPQNYFLSVFIDNGVYKYYYNGNTNATTIAPGATDIITITLELGGLTIRAGANPGALAPIVTIPYEYNQILHGAVSLLNNANSVTGLVYTPSPYQNSNVSGVSLVQDVADIQDLENYLQFDNVGAPPDARGSVHSIVLQPATMRLFGFTTAPAPDQAATKGSFNGTEIVAFGKLPETLTVEIPSLGLEGYDGEVHRRRPILAILPAEDVPGVQRDYSASFPIYIDMKNKDRQLLNTIQVRILDEGGVPINIEAEPGVIVTILVD